MSNKPRLNINALIFSCNEILIDVRRSYREVVRKAVQLYLEHAIGLSRSTEPLITPAEVTLLQKAGNFTSYWELTEAFIIYFIEMLPPVPAPTFPSKFHVPALMAYLQLAGGTLRVSIDTLREKRNIAQLAQAIAAAGGGLAGADKALPKENRHLLVSEGSITKTNIVGRIFQELYLGADLFERVYQEPAIIIQSTGYAEHESLTINPDILIQLSQQIALGVVSDRPRNEVERSLKAQGIAHYFQAIISLDEIQQARARPVPDPWPLLEVARQLELAQRAPAKKAGRFAYIGANIGDIQAAKKANQSMAYTAIGCLVGAPDKEALRKAFEENKANIILGHPDNLKELILG
jgi:phosphoglycolate phosphatase-like HAD superfamily hydrolase